MAKIFVDVLIHHEANGNMIPRSIMWQDGTEYEIDRVKSVCTAASLKAGGFGVRYTVRIRGKERYLFFERGAYPERWFVEDKGIEDRYD